MTNIVSKPDYGSVLIDGGVATDRFQEFLDDIEEILSGVIFGSQVSLKSYKVAELPPVTTLSGLIFITDEVDGAVPAFSDGTSWRRVTDRKIVS